MTTPHEQVPEFEARNNFLWFLLGLQSVAAALLGELSPSRECAGPVPEEVRPVSSDPTESILR